MSTAEVKLLPHQIDYLQSDTNTMLVAGFGCVHPDTKIWTDTGLIRIADIKGSTRVVSYNEKSRKFQLSLSGGAFPKGKANLYRVVTSRGEFVSSGHHRLLSSSGKYQEVSSLVAGESVALASPYLLQKIEESDQLSSLLDVQSYEKIDEDYLVNYADEARQYGRQLLQDLDSDLTSPPSQDGVPESYIHSDSSVYEREDAPQELSQEHNRHGQSSTTLVRAIHHAERASTLPTR